MVLIFIFTDCIWEELIQHKKGPKTIHDRPDGYVDSGYNFSLEMLNEMIHELNRLTTKYSSDDWNTKSTANRLVELLMEHIFFLQMEVNEVKSGARKLRDKDFLGPKTREARRQRRRTMENDAESASDNMNSAQETESSSFPWLVDHHQYFNAIGQKLFMKKRRGIRKARERRKAIETNDESSQHALAETNDGSSQTTLGNK